ncbi:carbohydrate kinase family protein [Candidatus Woesearchaeota archaeon]|nr:carbohydrate kinase family protein [Candidatus Woesearchaeota archaeon]
MFGSKYDVIALGSCTVDNFVIIKEGYKDLKPGDKVLIEHLFTEIGGAASNSSISLAKFGLKIKIITKLGADHNALIIKHKLKENNIDLHYAKSEKYMTPYAVILISKRDKDRIVFAYKGASDYLSHEDFNFSELNTKWIYLGSLLGQSFKTAEQVALYAKRKKINVLFNPSSYLAAKGKNGLHKILSSAKILILNKEEAQLVLGKKIEIKELLIGLKKLGPKIVVITDGKNTIHAINERCSYKLEPYKVKIVSTLGAGDAFAAGFLGSYIKNESIETSLRIGAANSASVLQHYGATTNTLSYKLAVEFVKKHHAKLEEHCKLKW